MVNRGWLTAAFCLRKISTNDGFIFEGSDSGIVGGWMRPPGCGRIALTRWQAGHRMPLLPTDRDCEPPSAVGGFFMRMIVYVSFPVETFNETVKDGTAGVKMKRILDQLQPETAYFTDRYGQRSAVLIVNLEDASQIPAIAEPWFLLFNAAVEVHPVMGPQDLASAGLEKLGKEWA